MIEGDDRKLFTVSLQRATQRHTGVALDGVLDELGWPDALAEDARTAVSLLFELQGSANATSSALGRVLTHALGLDPSPVLLPALGAWDPPGTRLQVHGLTLGRHDKTLCVVTGTHAVEVDTITLTQRVVGGIDPSLGLVEVTGDVRGVRELGLVDWPAAVALGQLALGHELVGAARRMLELAREHTLVRVQFGRPIAMFQAVRHRLAETLVAIEAAAAALDAAWLDRTPQAAAMAKATAGRSARVAARHCQQVLAGIGYTTEHPFHRYARRTLILEQLLGSTRNLTRALGHDILQRRELPAPLPL